MCLYPLENAASLTWLDSSRVYGYKHKYLEGTLKSWPQSIKMIAILIICTKCGCTQFLDKNATKHKAHIIYSAWLSVCFNDSMGKRNIYKHSIQTVLLPGCLRLWIKDILPKHVLLGSLWNMHTLRQTHTHTNTHMHLKTHTYTKIIIFFENRRTVQRK